ncbi:toxin [Serinibacter arcticus]|uniref:Toxin n=1 Tax=Serinibacter arcticus TaxID=1655435 RepID=A0A2U1ZZD8_9MICO|nr:toxin [Serinibacter arcticus]
MSDLAAVRRVRIVGVSGSGKTRLGAEVASVLGVAHLELDAVFWDAGWTFRDLEEARAVVTRFADEHPAGWVADGNWSSRLDGLLDPGTPGGADVLVWLDHSRARVMGRVVRRTLGRGLRGTELWHGNRETPRSWLRWDPEQNIMRWSWVQHPQLRRRMRARASAPGGDVVVRLAGERAVRAWVTALREAQPDREPRPQPDR